MFLTADGMMMDLFLHVSEESVASDSTAPYKWQLKATPQRVHLSAKEQGVTTQKKTIF